MSKSRTMNEIRQSKEYQIALKSSAHVVQDDIDVVKNKIVESLKYQLFDIIFQAVCDEMNQHHVFKEDYYLTEAGIDMFEDEWFEFYHDHHGDILNQVMKNITN